MTINQTLLNTLITVALSGGLITALATVYAAKRKVPAERDSIIVNGAETAVLALEKTLAAETRRADRAEAQIAARDKRIEALEAKLELLQSVLDEARAEIASFKLQ